jgi:AraC-like DNA-binding protein
MTARSVATDESQRRRAGRRGFDDRLDDVARALRVVDDPDALSQLRLARDPLIVALAERRYGRVTRLSRGCALRDLLKANLIRVADNASGPLAEFARAYAEQTPIAQIARQLGMSRAHLSRIYRPRLVAVVSDEFLAETRRDGPM